MSRVWEATASLPMDMAFTDVHDHLRRTVRRHIERDLLGYTLDSRFRSARLGIVDLPATEDMIADCDIRVDVLLALHKLSQPERALLVAYHGDKVVGKDWQTRMVGRRLRFASA